MIQIQKIHVCISEKNNFEAQKHVADTYAYGICRFHSITQHSRRQERLLAQKSSSAHNYQFQGHVTQIQKRVSVLIHIFSCVILVFGRVHANFCIYFQWKCFCRHHSMLSRFKLVQGTTKSTSYNETATNHRAYAIHLPPNLHYSRLGSSRSEHVLPNGPSRPRISCRMMPKAYTSPGCVPRGATRGDRSSSGLLHS